MNRPYDIPKNMMKYLKRFFWAAIFVCMSYPIFANDRYQQQARAGMEYAYQMQTEAATKIFDGLIQSEPENPQGYLFQAVNFYYRMQFDENPQRFESRFKNLMAQAIETSKKQSVAKEKKIEALFYLGTAYLYQAAFYGGQESWLKAYYYGRDGIHYLEKVVALAPDYYDAYLGLGLYHYYAEVMPKLLKTVSTLIGINGDKTRGLQELHTAAEKGVYSKMEALFFLGNIYLYMENDFEKSLWCARELTRLYPGNPGFQILLAENLQKQGQHSEAIDVLQQALTQNHELLPFFKVGIHYNLGNLYFEIGELHKAVFHYGETVEIASQSKAKVKKFRARANFKKAESFMRRGDRQQAARAYKSVKNSDDKRTYQLAQKRLRENKK